MNKTAIDNSAKDYWANYFKEYGKQWVRDIPRRIKQATRRNLKANNINGAFAPIAGDKSENGALSIEAAFVGTVDGQNAKILVTASFDPNGKLEEFVCNRIS